MAIAAETVAVSRTFTALSTFFSAYAFLKSHLLARMPTVGSRVRKRAATAVRVTSQVSLEFGCSWSLFGYLIYSFSEL